MRISTIFIVATLAIGATACGGRTTDGYAPGAAPTITSGQVLFLNRDDGKDAGSAVTIELLRRGAELGAEARTSGMHWEHDTTSAPVALSVTAPFRKTDVDQARLRIRLTPDGRDTWTFSPKLTMTFSDGTSQTYAWGTIKLDNQNPEVMLPLDSARIP